MTAPDIRDVPCPSCQNGYGEKHRCDWPDWCPCDQHGRAVTSADLSDGPLGAPLTVAQATGGTQPHPRTREPLSAFPWPCAKRTAHGPHLKWCPDHPPEQMAPGVKFERCPNCQECPGVKAHPGTMIGGGYRDE